MTSFTSPSDNGLGSLPVSCPPELSKEALSKFPAFRVWFATLQRSLARQNHPSHEFHNDPYVLRKIDVQAVDFFGAGKLGFVKLKAEVTNAGGENLPGSVFLRGGSVGMLVSAPTVSNLITITAKFDLLFHIASTSTRRCSSIFRRS